MEHYKVSLPRILPNNERETELIKIFLDNPDEVNKLWFKSSIPYLAWDKFAIKYQRNYFSLSKEFKDVTAEEAWFLLGIKRGIGGQSTLLKDTKDRNFRWSKIPSYEKDLHDFDMQLGGNQMAGKLASEKIKRERFLRQSLIEEAIASSQLEGAATTRERAKKMLTENSKPRSHDEWMIHNNYQTIRKIEQEAQNYPLSREVLLDLHILMTKNAIDEDKMGRWRVDEDEIVVKREIGGEEQIAHVPPPEKVLQKELDRLIAFANDEEENQHFLHPIVKAIMLHFWFGYLHPFCDGNGRLARSLFYWYLLKHGYWLMSYVPISTVIKKSPIQYADAYCYSEQYSNDLTYFLDYNFRKLRQALDLFNSHVDRVKEKSKEIDNIIPDRDLNDRQKQVMHHLLGKVEDELTARKHADFHEVSWLTASQDLKGLADRGYLDSEKRGREVYYNASEKLRSFLND